MKITELSQYKVAIKPMADIEGENGIPARCATDFDQSLLDYKEDIIHLFDSCEDVELDTIESYLKDNFSNIISVTLIRE